LKSNSEFEVVALAALLAFIIRSVNAQKGTGRFRPVDLKPAFQSNKQLGDLAAALGLTLVVGATAAVGWKHFWKAVVKRFAVRGAAAATLTVADGPLPIGDLMAAGLTLWTVIDVVRLSDQLWRDAAVIARQEA
jgi:hypothetical protein